MWVGCNQIIGLDPPQHQTADTSGTTSSGGTAGGTTTTSTTTTTTTSTTVTCTTSTTQAQPVLLAQDPAAQPQAIAVDAMNVYFTTGGGGGLWVVPIAGGTATPFVYSQAGAAGIALDSTNIYWANNGGGGVPGSVNLVPIGGGQTDIVQLYTGSDMPNGVAVQGGNVYFTTVGTQGAMYADGTVSKVPIAGGAVTPLVSNEVAPWWLWVDHTSLYWTTRPLPQGQDGGVRKVPIAGGTPTTIEANLTDPRWIVADAANVYFTVYGDGDVWQAPVGGGTPTKFAPSKSQNGPMGITVDASWVYWTNYANGTPGTGSVMKMCKAGGSPIPLTTGRVAPLAITVDADNIYWTEWNDYLDGGAVGYVFKMAK
jgi:hypothetical protein